MWLVLVLVLFAERGGTHLPLRKDVRGPVGGRGIVLSFDSWFCVSRFAFRFDFVIIGILQHLFMVVDMYSAIRKCLDSSVGRASD